MIFYIESRICGSCDYLRIYARLFRKLQEQLSKRPNFLRRTPQTRDDKKTGFVLDLQNASIHRVIGKTSSINAEARQNYKRVFLMGNSNSARFCNNGRTKFYEFPAWPLRKTSCCGRFYSLRRSFDYRQLNRGIPRGDQIDNVWNSSPCIHRGLTKWKSLWVLAFFTPTLCRLCRLVGGVIQMLSN